MKLFAMPLTTQIVAAVILSALLALTVGLGILFIAPPPQGKLVALSEVVSAISASPAELERMQLQRTYQRSAPGPQESSSLLSNALARRLNLPPASVRITNLRSGEKASKVDVKFVVSRHPQQHPDSAQALDLVYESLTDQQLPLPAFRTGILQADGRWLIIEPVQPFFSPWRQRILLALALSLSMVAPIAWWSARTVARPLRLLAHAADHLRIDASARPLRVEGASELRSVANSLNQMQRRLQRYAQTRITMLAAIAHDLRTPLTGLRLSAELVSEPARARMIADIHRMDAMIGQALNLVRDETLVEATEVLDLSVLARACVDDAIRRGGNAQLILHEPLLVLGGKIALMRAIGNVIDNALRYGQRAKVEVVRENGRALLTVSDDGPGIAEDHFEHVFEPYLRLEPSRNSATGGFGLGLASTRSIMQAHGGSVSLRNRPLGGLSVIISLRLHQG